MSPAGTAPSATSRAPPASMARAAATAARPAATGMPATTSLANARAATRAGSATGEQPARARMCPRHAAPLPRTPGQSPNAVRGGHYELWVRLPFPLIPPPPRFRGARPSAAMALTARTVHLCAPTAAAATATSSRGVACAAPASTGPSECQRPLWGLGVSTRPRDPARPPGAANGGRLVETQACPSAQVFLPQQGRAVRLFGGSFLPWCGAGSFGGIWQPVQPVVNGLRRTAGLR